MHPSAARLFCSASILLLFAGISAGAAVLPIREVTVFKDGHAFILCEGSMPTDRNGNVVMDELPIPELGTFFPYSAEQSAPLTSVVASRESVDGTRSAQSITELLQVNKGRQVEITGNQSEKIDGTVVDVQAGAASGPAGFVLVKTASGVEAFPVSDIRTLVFPGDYQGDVKQSETRARLTLSLGWHGRPASNATVGMMYLQQGLRWLPSYKVTIDGSGNAHVLLQATLVNDLADLDDVNANLVIGVPTFDFAGTPDPISLQQTLGQLTPTLSRDALTYGAYANSITTQAYPSLASLPVISSAVQPEVAAGHKNEDMFVFTVHHVTLKKGQTMVLPVTEFDLKYADVYTLDLPAVPPRDALQYLDYATQQNLRTAIEQTQVIHKIRLTDTASVPLTTAPALILHGGRVVSQSTMTYTSVGGQTDLKIAPAVNVKPKHKDVETKNTPNALQWDGYNYAKVDLDGSVEVSNCESKPIDLEVTRHVMGHVDTATDQGEIEALNSVDAEGYTVSSNYSTWWDHLNGYGKIFWKVSVDPKQCAKLKYAWHYYYR